MRLPAPSKLAIAMAGCLHPFTSGIHWPRNDSVFSNYGKAPHRVGELLIKNQPVDLDKIGDEFSLSDEERKTLRRDASNISEWLEDRWVDWAHAKSEVILAFDVDAWTTRELRSMNERHRSEMVLILDVVASWRSGALELVDWKAGRQYFTSDAQNSIQLQMCALAASILYGVEDVRIGLANLTPDGIYHDRAHLDCFDLAAFSDRLRAVVDDLRKGPTPPVPGVHCTRDYCPIIGICSATRSALVEVTAPEFSLDLSDDETAARVYLKLKQAQAALDAISNKLDERARRSPIPLPSGKHYGLVEGTSTKIDRLSLAGVDALGRHAMPEHVNEALDVRVSAELLPVLRAHVPAESLGKLVEIRTSRSAAETAAAATARAQSPGKRGAIGQAKAAVVAEIERVGDARSFRFSKVQEFNKAKCRECVDD